VTSLVEVVWRLVQAKSLKMASVFLIEEKICYKMAYVLRLSKWSRYGI